MIYFWKNFSTLQDIWQQLITNIRQTQWPEWVSALAQVISVWYARKNNVLVYPTGIIGVLLAAYVYFFMVQPPLIAYGALNLYYFLMSLYGWYNWLKKKDNGQFTYPISWCTVSERLIGLFIFAASWVLIYLVLMNPGTPATPVMESLVSASAVTAMWWMAKRKIENWLAWIFSNLAAIPLNFSKGLIFFSLMYGLFLLMAWWGFQEWKQKFTTANGN
ncbi:MAG: nicotinamide riboside transporter PnuC [Chitinophagaceae bacterium]|nr:nicotinamide riboside transporter PnuC [Chitinophagaceae bacterium]